MSIFAANPDGEPVNMAARHRFATFVACFTFLVIIAGGTVTSTGSGLSVPDWPLSFGGLMPRMVGGVFFEHGHRMVAATAGLLITIMAFWTASAEPRRSVRWLGWALLGTVIMQGVLGGVTVLLRLPPAVSSSHAAIAQLTFCLAITMALITSPAWLRTASSLPDAGFMRLRTLAPLTTSLLYLQILLGAVVRHTGAGLSIPDFPTCFGGLYPTPDTWTFAVLIHFAHRVGACIVTIAIATLAIRVFTQARTTRQVTIPVAILCGLVLVQIGLGATIIWTGRLVVATVAHVAGGALLLGTSLIETLWVYRLTAPAHD